MKKLFIIIVVIFAFLVNVLSAQDSMVPPPLDSLVNTNLIYRGKLPFLLGWNWAAHGFYYKISLYIQIFSILPLLWS